MRTFNIYQTYFDKTYPWTGILAAAVFSIFLTTNRLKAYSLGRFIFGRDIILLKKHKVGWELICQQNHTKINKDNIRENRNQVYHDYKFRDDVMLNNHTAYQYETPYTGPILITHCFSNGTVDLLCGPKQLGIIYVALSHINLILKLKILVRKICLTMSTYDHQLYNFY